MPSKHDMGGAADTRPSASFPKAIPTGGARKDDGTKNKGKKP
jgi:hypothetical protein